MRLNVKLDPNCRRQCRRILYVILLVASILVLRYNTNTHAAIKEKPLPHIVFVLADDLGWNDLGFNNDKAFLENVSTPNLDRLAEKGLKFNNYYVQPCCSPTRSQLLTGKYQIHTGLQHSIIHRPQRNGIPLDVKTLPEALRELGYVTKMVGKWHLGFFKKEYTPLYRGFQSFFGLLGGSFDYYKHTWTSQGLPIKPEMVGRDLYNNEHPVKDFDGIHATELFSEEAQRVIRKYNSCKPLFLYLPFTAPHSPMQVPEKFKNMYRGLPDSRMKYLGLVTQMDEAVGKIIKSLKEKRMWNNTLFVFSSDNGGANRYGGSNYPLRGDKGSLFEGGIKSLCFAYGAGINNGKISDLMHVTDWFPTLISMAGGKYDHVDGYNMWDLINKGTPGKRNEILINIDPMQRASKIKREKHGFDTAVESGLRYENWKLLTGVKGMGQWVKPNASHFRRNSISNTSVWLFNLAKDPLEKHNVAASNPSMMQFMLRRLAIWNNTAVPVRFPKLDPLSNPQLRNGFWGPWVDT